LQLVRDAIRAGIFNDLGSGSNVDVTVIRKGGDVERMRTYENAAGSAKVRAHSTCIALHPLRCKT